MGSSTLSQWATTLGLWPSSHQQTSSDLQQQEDQSKLLTTLPLPTTSPSAATTTTSLPAGQNTEQDELRRVHSSELGAALQPFVQWLRIDLPPHSSSPGSGNHHVQPALLPRVPSVDSSSNYSSNAVLPSVSSPTGALLSTPTNASVSSLKHHHHHPSSSGAAMLGGDVSPGLGPLQTPPHPSAGHHSSRSGGIGSAGNVSPSSVPYGGGSVGGLTNSPLTASSSPGTTATTVGSSGGCDAPHHPPRSPSSSSPTSLTLTIHTLRSLLKFIGVKPQFATEGGNLLINALTLESLGYQRYANKNSGGSRSNDDCWEFPTSMPAINKQNQHESSTTGPSQQQQKRGRKKEMEELIPPMTTSTTSKAKLFIDGFISVPTTTSSTVTTNETDDATTVMDHQRLKKEVYSLECLRECLRILAEADANSRRSSGGFDAPPPPPPPPPRRVEGYPEGSAIDSASAGFVLEITLAQFQSSVRHLLNVQRQMIGSSTQDHLVSLRRSAVEAAVVTTTTAAPANSAIADMSSHSMKGTDRTGLPATEFKAKSNRQHHNNQHHHHRVATSTGSGSAVSVATPTTGNAAASAVATTLPTWGLSLSARRLDDRVMYSLMMQQRGRPMVVLVGGTSGCGKSTLANLLANRLGIATVISTDGVRELLRTRRCPRCFPELFASTYEAHKERDAKANKSEGKLCDRHVAAAAAGQATSIDALNGGQANPLAETVGGDDLRASGSSNSEADDESAAAAAVAAAALAEMERRVVRSFERQCKLVLQVVDQLLRMHLKRGESVLVEGVHLLPEYCARLTKALQGSVAAAANPSISNPRTPVHISSSPLHHVQGDDVVVTPDAIPLSSSASPKDSTLSRASSASPNQAPGQKISSLAPPPPPISPPPPILCISMIVHIVREEKHLLRFAIRSKSMTLKPQDNKYVANFNSIRWIQKTLLEGAKSHNLLLVNNTNVDKSLSTIQTHVLHAVDRLLVSSSAAAAHANSSASSTTQGTAMMSTTASSVSAGAGAHTGGGFVGLEDVKGKVLLNLLRVRRREKQLRRARSADAPHTLTPAALASIAPPAALTSILPISSIGSHSLPHVAATPPSSSPSHHANSNVSVQHSFPFVVSGGGSSVTGRPNTPTSGLTTDFPSTRIGGESVPCDESSKGAYHHAVVLQQQRHRQPRGAHHHHHNRDAHVTARMPVVPSRSFSADASNPRHVQGTQKHHRQGNHFLESDPLDASSSADTNTDGGKGTEPLQPRTGRRHEEQAGINGDGQRSGSPTTDDGDEDGDVCSDGGGDVEEEEDPLQQSLSVVLPADGEAPIIRRPRALRGVRRRQLAVVVADADEDDETPSLVGS